MNSLRQSIEKSKEQPLWRLLFALSISGSGRSTRVCWPRRLDPPGDRRVALAAAFGRLRHPVVAAM